MLNYFSIPSQSFNGPVLITGAGGCIGAWTMAMLLKENIACLLLPVDRAHFEGDKLFYSARFFYG